MSSNPWPERENLPRHHIDKGSRAYRFGVVLGQVLILLGLILTFAVSGTLMFFIVVKLWSFIL